MKRLNQFQPVRFITAVLIVAFHFGADYFPFNVYPISIVSIIGGELVSFFFVLSGFILTMVYYPKPGEKISFLPFIVRRLSRIYPIYLVAILAMMPFQLSGASPPSLRDYLLDITFLQTWLSPFEDMINWPAWALSVIFSFYVLFPFVLNWLSSKGLRFSIWAITSFWVASQVMFHLVLYADVRGLYTFLEEFLRKFAFFHLNTFFIGMLGGMIFLKYKDKKTDSKQNLLWLSVSILLLFVYFFYGTVEHKILGVPVNYRHGLLAPLYLAYIYFLARDTSALSSFLSKRAFFVLGEVSFSIYLLQLPMKMIYQNYLVAPLNEHFPWMAHYHFYLYLLLLIGLSVIFYHLIERPIQGVIRKGYTRLNAK